MSIRLKKREFLCDDSAVSVGTFHYQYFLFQGKRFLNKKKINMTCPRDATNFEITLDSDMSLDLYVIFGFGLGLDHYRPKS